MIRFNIMKNFDKFKKWNSQDIFIIKKYFLFVSKYNRIYFYGYNIGEILYYILTVNCNCVLK